MTTELIILLILSLFIWPAISTTPRNTFINAGAYLGGRIERQLDTGAGFQEKAFHRRDGDPLHWTPP